jgi:hypothetical protein
LVVVEDHQQRKPSMSDISTLGIDLSKHVFQLHGVDGAGQVEVDPDRGTAGAVS